MKRFLIVLALVALAVTGCKPHTPNPQGAQVTGQKLTEQAFKNQQAAQPYPADQLSNSLERANLRRRLLATNDPNKIGYVYLVDLGKIYGYYVIKGKVSNTDSQMTVTSLIQWTCRTAHGCQPVVVPAPGDDGSYGLNETGNFLFTTEGVLVEFDTHYIYADQPLPIDVPRFGGTSPVKK